MPEFYKTHNMDSLAQYFDTKEIDDYVHKFSPEDLTYTEYHLDEGYTNLKVYRDENGTSVIYVSDMAEGEAVEVYEFWLKSGSVIYSTECTDAVDIEAYEQGEEDYNYHSCRSFYFFEGNLVKCLKDSVVQPFKVRCFTDDNNYILNEYKRLKEFYDKEKDM